MALKILKGILSPPDLNTRATEIQFKGLILLDISPPLGQASFQKLINKGRDTGQAISTHSETQDILIRDSVGKANLLAFFHIW